MPFTVLPRSTPSAQGVDAVGVEAFLDAMADHPQVELHSLMLLRNGHVVTEGWWSPYTPERVHLLYSLSKSFVSTAAGFAVAEGLLDLDRTVLSYFPELDADVTDERSRSMLVRHVAAMASGHHAETIEQVFGSDPADLVRGFLRIPPEHEPGTWFAYNQPCTYTMAAIVQRESGQYLVDYLTPRLFEPLGIDRVGWQQHPPGRALGFTGLHASTEAIAKLGQLHLQRGWWRDRRLLPEDWVDEATSLQVANPHEENPDWSQGYGFQFWMARHGYRGDGAYGQFCVVLPEQQTVVAITGATIDMQAVLDGLWTHLLPALSDDHRSSPDRTAADLHLARRMTSLELEPANGKRDPERAGGQWQRAQLPPVGGSCEDQPSLRRVDVSEADGTWWVTLVEDGGPLAPAPISGGAWQVVDETSAGADDAVPLAVSGGWVDDRLVVEVLFLETPHRLLITVDLDQGFTARWGTVPLRAGTLQDLRKPT
jgi:CubicO group peptidase (beta-lactamase class C family)